MPKGKKIYTNCLFFGKTQQFGIPVLLFFLFLGKLCKGQQEIKPCNQVPEFIQTLGFDPLWTALSTSEKKVKGLSLVVYQKNPQQKSPTQNTPRETVYQHPSWSKVGYLSTISFDTKGNAYVIPAPLISMLDNPLNALTTVYQVNHRTGDMEAWRTIGKKQSSKENPYGFLGITYDCKTDRLAISSVSASTRQQEKGTIYLVQVSSKKIVDSLTAFDAMGMCMAIDETGRKRLYFGSARTGDIYSIAFTSKERFDTKTFRKELTLELLGPRGDDKARKIRFQNNAMIVNGIAFNFNLQASSEKPETLYTFIRNAQSGKWELADLK